MNFISIKTYGREKNRVIKTDLWISPEVRKDRLFASTSSESSVESTSSASVVNDEVKHSWDPLPSEEKSVVQHSTPFSCHPQTSLKPQRLIILSSPVTSASSSKQNKKSLVGSPLFITDNSCIESSLHSDDASRDISDVQMEENNISSREFDCKEHKINSTGSPSLGNDENIFISTDVNNCDLTNDHSVCLDDNSAFSGSDVQELCKSVKKFSLDEVISSNNLRAGCGKFVLGDDWKIELESSSPAFDVKNVHLVNPYKKETDNGRWFDAEIRLPKIKLQSSCKATNQFQSDLNAMKETHKDEECPNGDPKNVVDTTSSFTQPDVPQNPSLSKKTFATPQHRMSIVGCYNPEAYCSSNERQNGVLKDISNVQFSSSIEYSGRTLKNHNCSSFVESLTPARFQVYRDRKRPQTSLEKILAQCGQQGPLKFEEILSASVLEKCVKIGEGTYGEVFKTNDGGEDIALKIIPVEGNFFVNGEPQKSFDDMVPEIVITKELSSLGDKETLNSAFSCSNFIQVKRIMLIKDCYPEKLLNEWEIWKNKHKCENDCPDMFEKDQYFIVFEFMEGGEDLEHFQFKTMTEALSVLQQVALALSVAENVLMFEHRDLHWGNILIKRTTRKNLHYKFFGGDISIRTFGLFVSMIDFTLSRLTKDGLTVYCDLAKDPAIFKGKGDYQFQVYRQMKKHNSNNWERFNPFTNLLWLKYLLDKILNAKTYKQTDNGIQRQLRSYFRQVLSYESASLAIQDAFLGVEF